MGAALLKLKPLETPEKYFFQIRTARKAHKGRGRVKIRAVRIIFKEIRHPGFQQIAALPDALVQFAQIEMSVFH